MVAVLRAVARGSLVRVRQRSGVRMQSWEVRRVRASLALAFAHAR